MTFWQHLRQVLGFTHSDERLTFEVEDGLILSLQDLAHNEKRAEDEVAAELFSMAIAQRDAATARLEQWRTLSPREQQVAGLICLGYTNRQIAARLVISPETAKTHVRNVLRKFNLNSKATLRYILAEWDFSTWERADF